MVKFDELRISEDGQFLTVECHIDDYAAYSDMYIESIYLDYYKNRNPVSGPSEHKIILYEHVIESQRESRAVRARISTSAIPQDFGTNEFSRGMFYVYVHCEGTPTAEAETMGCGADNPDVLGVIIDWHALYEKIMPLVARFSAKCSPCEIPSNFENLILLWNAFRFAVDACDWAQAERLWEELMGLENDGHVSAGCVSCH